VKNGKWVRTPIDRFILPSSKPRVCTPTRRRQGHAAPARQLRLIGLPPTPGAAFLADTAATPKSR
jgi:hypothetical protein